MKREMKCFIIKIILIFYAIAKGCAELEEQNSPPMKTFFYMSPSGGYGYAYRTASGMESGQMADATNEVMGYYMYYHEGAPYMVKYRAGVKGYQPEFISLGDKPLETINEAKPKANEFKKAEAAHVPTAHILTQSTKHNGEVKNEQNSPNSGSQYYPYAPKPSSFQGPSKKTHPYITAQQSSIYKKLPDFDSLSAEENVLKNVNEKSLQPYSFLYQGHQSVHAQTGDKLGNVKGSYSYIDEGGYHDLSYQAGDNIGFVVLGGSLSKPLRDDFITSAKRKRYAQFVGYAPHSQTLGVDNAASNENENIKQRSLRKFQRYTRW